MQEVQERWVWSLGEEDPLEEGMHTHSSVLTWRIPRSKDPGGLQSMVLQRVRHDWSDSAHTRAVNRTPSHAYEAIWKDTCQDVAGGDLYVNRATGCFMLFLFWYLYFQILLQSLGNTLVFTHTHTCTHTRAHTHTHRAKQYIHFGIHGPTKFQGNLPSLPAPTTPHISLEIFLFSAKYLSQFILDCWYFVRLIVPKWHEFVDFMADLQKGLFTDKNGFDELCFLRSWCFCFRVPVGTQASTNGIFRSL